jgi:hypothetical protein
MAKNVTFTYGERGFWVRDDAMCVWLAHLIDELEEGAPYDDPWFGELTQKLRGCAVVGEFAWVDKATPTQLARLLDVAGAARRRAIARGDLSVDEIRGWRFPVAYRDDVAVGQVLEVADACISLLDGTLPPDPPRGAWRVGFGEGRLVMPYHGADPGGGYFRKRR